MKNLLIPLSPAGQAALWSEVYATGYILSGFQERPQGMEGSVPHCGSCYESQCKQGHAPPQERQWKYKEPFKRHDPERE